MINTDSEECSPWLKNCTHYHPVAVRQAGAEGRISFSFGSPTKRDQGSKVVTKNAREGGTMSGYPGVNPKSSLR